MAMLGAGTISKWADSRFSERSSAFLLWLSIYSSMLILGVLGDITYCEVTPLPLIWAQILPELHYIGVIFAATCFGAAFGFTAACAAGILHMTAMMMTCNGRGLQIGHLVMFAGVGLITGIISKHRAFVSVRTQERGRGTQEGSRGVSLSELGRMMPEVVQQFLTPIASIEGAGYVLAESDLSDNKRQEFLDIIRKECRRLQLLVELLDVTQSRLSTYEETNIIAVLDEVIERCRTAANSRIILRNVAPPVLPRVHCDPELIQYVLQSLMTIAIHSIPERGEIDLSARSAPREIVINVEVRAESSGSPFDTSLTREFRGIDVAVVQHIIDRHHGSLCIDPSSAGVSISIFLPLKSG